MLLENKKAKSKNSYEANQEDNQSEGVIEGEVTELLPHPKQVHTFSPFCTWVVAFLQSLHSFSEILAPLLTFSFRYSLTCMIVSVI